MAPLIPKNADMYSIEWKLFLIKSICVFLRSLSVFAPELKMDMVMLKASAQCEYAHIRYILTHTQISTYLYLRRCLILHIKHELRHMISTSSLQ